MSVGMCLLMKVEHKLQANFLFVTYTVQSAKLSCILYVCTYNMCKCAIYTSTNSPHVHVDERFLE